MSTRRLTLVLAGLAMIGPFAIDTYLPSFLSIARHYEVSALMMQQTLSVYLFTSATMTLFYGTMSDTFGRRPVILGALALFAGASIGAALAPTFGWLLVFRALQGLCAGAGMVVGQAIVRDRFHGAAAQRMMSNIMMVFGIAPAVAPVLGGYLNTHLGWQANFAFLAGFAALLLLVCLRALPESLPLAQRHPLHLGTILGNYATAIRHPEFRLGVFAIGTAFIGFALYIASAANFVLQVLHLPETAFAWLFVPMIGGMVLGSATGARLAHRLAPSTLIRAGFSVMAGAAFINLVYNALFVAAVPWAVLPVMLYTFGTALALPAMAVITQGLFPAMRGLAASLQNFVQMMIFALVSGFVAPLLFGSAFKLALGMAAGVLLSAGCWYASAARPPQPERRTSASTDRPDLD